MTHSLWLRLTLFSLVAAAGCALDLATKQWIFSELGEPGRQGVWWLIPDLFGFQTSLNQGALFGMGQGQIAFFVATSVLALLGIVVWIVLDRRRSLFLALLLALITAGILGNLWDRLALHEMTWNVFHVLSGQCPPEMAGQPIHAVRDWILVMLGTYPWPNFNLADSMLVVGAIVMAIYAFCLDDENAGKQASQAPQPAASEESND
ncbi:MAG: signal peptidase II [Planctomycetia bacterium]|nr:signal peptidase II [Planctomycetia bacterium]